MCAGKGKGKGKDTPRLTAAFSSFATLPMSSLTRTPSTGSTGGDDVSLPSTKHTAFPFDAPVVVSGGGVAGGVGSNGKGTATRSSKSVRFTVPQAVVVAPPAAPSSASGVCTTPTAASLASPSPSPSLPSAFTGATPEASPSVHSSDATPLPAAAVVDPSSPHGCSPLPSERADTVSAYGDGDTVMGGSGGEVTATAGAGLAPSGSEAPTVAPAVAADEAPGSDGGSAARVAAADGTVVVDDDASVASVPIGSVAGGGAGGAGNSSAAAGGVSGGGALDRAVPAASSTKMKKSVPLSSAVQQLDVTLQVGTRIRELRDEFFVVRFAPLPAEGGEQRTLAVDDDAKVLSCEFFDTRSGFLRMCQGNNYQVGVEHVSVSCVASLTTFRVAGVCVGKTGFGASESLCCFLCVRLSVARCSSTRCVVRSTHR